MRLARGVILVTPTDEQVDAQLANDPIPSRWHACRPVAGYGSTDYCACGARYGFWTNYEWVDRNSRRKRIKR